LPVLWLVACRSPPTFDNTAQRQRTMEQTKLKHNSRQLNLEFNRYFPIYHSACSVGHRAIPLSYECHSRCLGPEWKATADGDDEIGRNCVRRIEQLTSDGCLASRTYETSATTIDRNIARRCRSSRVDCRTQKCAMIYRRSLDLYYSSTLTAYLPAVSECCNAHVRTMTTKQ